MTPNQVMLLITLFLIGFLLLLWFVNQSYDSSREKSPSEMNILELLINAFIEMGKFAAENPEKRSNQAEYSKTTYAPSDLRQLNPDTFEELIGEIWSEKGYEYTLTKDGADGGLDLILESDEEIVGVQVKRYGKGNKVGTKVVRETVGATHRIDADRTIVATSSSFTNPAEEEAKNMNVQLYDGPDIANFANRYLN